LLWRTNTNVSYDSDATRKNFSAAGQATQAMMISVHIPGILATYLLLTLSSAWSQQSVMEAEPNDTPADAARVAGEVVLIGSMAGGDQDAYLWTVSDEDARKRWTFELHGVPGRLTIVQISRLEYAENGIDVTRAETLMTMGTRDGLTPSIHESLMFEPGEYLLGLAGAGGGNAAFRPPTASLSFGDDENTGGDAAEAGAGGYRVIISEGSRLPLKSKAKSRATRDSAFVTRLGTEFAALTFEPSSWYRFDFDAKAALQRWEIAAQVPLGRDVTAILTNDAGDKLASARSDGRGKFGFKDLGPPIGSWWVELQTAEEGGFVQAIGIEATGQRVAGAEIEPNDKAKLANIVDLTQPLTGRMGKKGETDFFRFSLDEATTDQLLELQLENISGQKIQFCLLNGRMSRVQCRESTRSIVLPDLVLTPGDWGLSVARGSDGSEYRITLDSPGPINAATEAEPNDALKFASSVPSKNRIKGSFSGADKDFFRFVIADEPQLWRFQVIGEGVQEVAYLDSAGGQSQRIRPKKGQRRIRLDNVYLLPGVHHLSIKGKDGGKYTLLARPQGQPNPNGEREPNNDTKHMQHLAMGQTRIGLLADEDDKDYYRFFLGNRDRIRLTIQPPPDGSVQPALYWYSSLMKELRAPAVGEPIVLDGLFPPGDYHIALAPRETSEAEYTLSLERLPRFGCAIDCEPNDNPAFANPISANLVVEGVAGDWRDRDIYALPVRDEPTEWTLKVTPQQTPKISRQSLAQSVLELDRDAGIFRGTVPAGEAYYLFVPGNRKQPYRIELDYPGSDKVEPPESPPLPGLTLNLADREVAAYRRNGQRLAGNLVVRNESGSPQMLELAATTSDYRWTVELEQTSVQIAPGAEITVPLKVNVPADAWADWPVRVSAMLSDADGRHTETFAEVNAGREASAVNPQWGWTIPEPLMGGFNAARSALGGRLVGTYDAAKGFGFENLFNGVDVRGQGLSLRGAWKGESYRDIVIELAGRQAVDVVGTAINLFHTESVLKDLRILDFALSLDGETFQTVMEQTLQPIKTEQYFVLDEATPARFARLRLQHNFRGDLRGSINLAEWKVLARPGTDLSSGKGFNLADPELGGHVVYARPWVTTNWDQSLLVKEEFKWSVRPNPGQRFEFVIGFHHNRAAQIRKLEWEKTVAAKPDTLFKKVQVAVSLESPHGPWRSLGEWDLTGADASAVITLAQPEWARFVKVTTAASDTRRRRSVPERIRIWERPTDAEYRSILTEWGYASKAAIYESLQELDIDVPLKPVGHDSRARAAPITPGQPVGGAVSLGRQDHWYRLSVPAGQNTLQIELAGDPTVRTVVYLEDAASEPVPVHGNVQKNTTRRHWFEAIVEPGADYYLRIEEPPRNVVFSWDTSPSVAPYLQTIYNSLVAFTDDVVPGRDAVNLVPFGSGPLLRDWYGEPYILQTVLNDFLSRQSSSSAEGTLRRSSRELAPLSGTKAIVVITDATTPRDDRMWDEFERVRPRIFGIGIGGGMGASLEQDLFQDWSDVNAGYYKHMVYDGEMEIAFDRAATMLRRPAIYSLLVETGFREDPGPGTLTVIRSKGGVGGAGAVELILDASGSMWQRLDGKFRIDIAKEVLIEAVEKYIPSGTPTVIRVFGHREPNACRTDLEMSLRPLDPAVAAKLIRAIEPQSLARTPIAASIASIESDLGKAEGRKTVVLVTDGEETCDGKPEAVIEKLGSKGFDISLNIVGFAIGDEELEGQFADWAELGGGRYFSAGDQEGLSTAIASALQVPYTVYDKGGSKIADGLVGGKPIELDAGRYTVVVASSPRRTFENVDVPGGDAVSLELD
jgi:hypothetical protein